MNKQKSRRPRSRLPMGPSRSLFSAYGMIERRSVKEFHKYRRQLERIAEQRQILLESDPSNTKRLTLEEQAQRKAKARHDFHLARYVFSHRSNM